MIDNRWIEQMILMKMQMSPNPAAKNAVEMYRNGNFTGLQNLAQNMCQQTGKDPQALLNSFFGSGQTK